MITLKQITARFDKEYEKSYYYRQGYGIGSPEYREAFKAKFRNILIDLFIETKDLDYHQELFLGIQLASYIFFFEEEGLSQESNLTSLIGIYKQLKTEMDEV